MKIQQGKLRVDNAVKKLRTMKHPGVLRYIDSIELDDSVIVVTEPVKPIFEVLEEMREYDDWIAWGLNNIVETLKFLGENCSLVHAQILLRSIFVCPSGEWKLGGVELLSEANSGHILSTNKQILSQIIPKHYQAPESLRQNWSPTLHFDLFQLGVLIYELFNGPTNTVPNAPKKVPKVQKNFSKEKNYGIVYLL